MDPVTKSHSRIGIFNRQKPAKVPQSSFPQSGVLCVSLFSTVQRLLQRWFRQKPFRQDTQA